ncbi:UNVERIFIED_CONTAM: hypothetical protein FKN15_077030 [Acipenser sinensis]
MEGVGNLGEAAPPRVLPGHCSHGAQLTGYRHGRGFTISSSIGWCCVYSRAHEGGAQVSSAQEGGARASSTHERGAREGAELVVSGLWGGRPPNIPLPRLTTERELYQVSVQKGEAQSSPEKEI